MKILSDNKEIHFSKKDLPFLVSGKQGTGSSLFSVMLAIDIFRQGNKVLFFSSFPMAKDDLFKELTSEEKEKVTLIKPNEPPYDKQLLVIDSGEESELIKTLDQILDLKERIILIKNADNYSLALFEKIKKHPLRIVSGDLDSGVWGDQTEVEAFPTKIFFSWPKQYSHKKLSDPIKYQGILLKGGMESIVSLEK